MTKEKLLYEQYLKLQSKEWKEEIIGYRNYKETGKKVCIRVTFTWDILKGSVQKVYDVQNVPNVQNIPKGRVQNIPKDNVQLSLIHI